MGFGDVGRAEIHHDAAGLRRLAEEQMFAPRGRLQCGSEHFRLKAKIQKARTGDLDFIAQGGHVEFGEDIGGELARIEFARLGHGHQGVGLVIAKLRITRAHENGSDISVRQHRADSFLESELDLFMWQHGNYLTTDGHGWARIKTDANSGAAYFLP
jgi:uncharacterized protein YjhX (UPF0386 family)